CSQHRSRCPTVSDVSCALLCARKTPLHPERYYPHARIRVFHHSGPEIPGSAREGKPRSFFLCFVANLRNPATERRSFWNSWTESHSPNGSPPKVQSELNTR